MVSETGPGMSYVTGMEDGGGGGAWGYTLGGHCSLHKVVKAPFRRVVMKNSLSSMLNKCLHCQLKRKLTYKTHSTSTYCLLIIAVVVLVKKKK